MYLENKVNTNRVRTSVGDSLRRLDAVLLHCCINTSYFIMIISAYFSLRSFILIYLNGWMFEILIEVVLNNKEDE